ncbi:FixH family protein [Bizionia paragorgiae]|jgi:nitrogen fixation protein FixH|uniref:FixH protein n=1 Tax=Bizionia paragorgiae TaxID=283786 RepID=A0A1H3ZDE4_BIZPA|nr:FixH family protein [Bizionia paragorgiae]MDX1271341.1 FixH family protein [Bizionia paragorgiae]SEA21635.1 FixH protein [Bizionia paragorgiae]
MKWNWGTGLVVAMALFMGFILYLVITMSTDSKFDYDLVTEEYYAKEVVYQKEIDAETNTNSLKEKIVFESSEDGLKLIFPETFEASKMKGNVYLYRPSNQVLDFNVPLELEGSVLLVNHKNLIDGRWNIIIDWEYEGTPYMYKKSFTY